MYSLTSKIRENQIAFDNIQLSADWCLKHLGIAKFQIALIKILMKLTLTENGQPILHMSGEIWTGGQKIMSGQICSALLETNLAYNRKFTRLAEIWMKYHMNNMQPGTAGQLNMLYHAILHQELAPEDWKNIPVCFDYLYKRGMADDNGIIYGGGMKYLPIPSSILNELDTLFAHQNCA